MKCLFVLFCLVLLQFHSCNLIAQALNEKDSIDFKEPIFTAPMDDNKSNHISFALGYLANNLLFPNRLGAVFSSSYSYSTSDALEIELGAYYLDYYDDANKRFYGVLTTSFTGELNAIVQPIKNTPLRLGVGTAIRWYTRFLFLDTNPMFGFPSIYYADILQLGVNAKVEYLFPIDQTLDIGIRGQSQFFFQPFSVISNAFTLPSFDVGSPGLRFGALSLSAFLRIGF